MSDVAADRSRLGLVRAAHAGPALAVVVLAALLGVASGLSAARTTLVAAAVLAGQLSVGWSNDLVDERRDRAVGRVDKPLVAGDVARRTVLAACGAAVGATVVLSLACGWWAGLVHLGCVAAAWAYNLGLKATRWSWAPYAVAFGGLVVFVSLAGDTTPAWWLPTAAALLGVAAHLLNVLPDLADDAATGIRGLPHRLGPRLIPPVAAVVLLGATIVLVVGIGAGPLPTILTLVVVAALAAGVLAGRGGTPFALAVAIALADVVLLLAAT